ncbi:MAG: hypothetical protein AAF390_14230 [Pseudomonadota bacterium]
MTIDGDFQHLSAEVREGLDRARSIERRKTGGKMRVQVGEAWYPIRAFDETGFEVALDDTPHLRGLVEIHDGPRMVRSALIVAGMPDGDRMRYEFKRATVIRETAPLDYVRTGEAPVGYLPPV